MSLPKTNSVSGRGAAWRWSWIGLTSLAVLILASGCCHRGKMRYGRMKYGKRGCVGKRCGGKAKGGRCGKGGFGKLLCPGKILRKKKCLKLTDEQVKQLKTLHQQCKKDKNAFRLAMMRVKARSRVQWLADQPKAESLSQLVQKKLAAKSTWMKQKLANALAVRKVLTLVQYQKLLLKSGRKGKRRGGCKGKGRGGCAGKGCGGCAGKGRGGCKGGRGGFKRPCGGGGAPCGGKPARPKGMGI